MISRCLVILGVSSQWFINHQQLAYNFHRSGAAPSDEVKRQHCHKSLDHSGVLPAQLDTSQAINCSSPLVYKHTTSSNLYLKISFHIIINHTNTIYIIQPTHQPWTLSRNSPAVTATSRPLSRVAPSKLPPSRASLVASSVASATSSTRLLAVAPRARRTRITLTRVSSPHFCFPYLNSMLTHPSGVDFVQEKFLGQGPQVLFIPPPRERTQY